MAEINNELEELKRKLAEAEKRAEKAEKKVAKAEAQLEESEKKLAEASENAEADAEKAAKNIKQVLDAEEKVTIRLFKDNNRYNEDVYVSINGYGYLVKRGVDVEVPKSVANVLRNSQMQDEAAAEMLEALSKKADDPNLR